MDALITGTLTPFGDSVRLACKVVDTTTAKVIGGARGSIPRTGAIEELLSRAIAPAPPPQAATQPPWAPECDAMAAGPPAAEANLKSFANNEDKRHFRDLGRAKAEKIWKAWKEGAKVYKAKQFAAAVKIFEGILLDDPLDWNAHYMLAASYADLKKSDLVLEHACAALKGFPERSLFLAVAMAFEQKGERFRSLRWLDTALGASFALKKRELDEMFPTLANDNDYRAVLAKHAIAAN